MEPLHVRVAKALGCTVEESRYGELAYICACPRSAHITHHDEDGHVLRYDTDWSAAGHLIERFGIDLRYARQALTWYAGECGGILVGHALAPLEAVCNLILALHAAGKLDTVKEAVR